MNHLNDSDVDGNTMAWMNDKKRDEGIEHEDRYICRSCSAFVLERNFNHKFKVCNECLEEI